MPEIILNIRNKPENQTYLFQDNDTFILRNIYFLKSREVKSRSIPLSAVELLYLADFIKSLAFRNLIKE